MYNVLVSLAVVISILLTIIVSVQKPKGGGLAANFSASNNILGVRKTTDFLEKATWSLVIILVVLSVASAAFISKGVSAEETQSSALKNIIEQTATPNANQTPIMPTSTPAAE